MTRIFWGQIPELPQSHCKTFNNYIQLWMRKCKYQSHATLKLRGHHFEFLSVKWSRSGTPERCRTGPLSYFTMSRHIPVILNFIYTSSRHSSFRAAPPSCPDSPPSCEFPPSLHSVRSAPWQIKLEIIYPHNDPSPSPRGVVWWNHFLALCFSICFSAWVWKSHGGRTQ